MIIAGLVVITYGLILSLAPAVRYHAGSERYQFQHWIGVILWGISFSLLHHQTRRKLPQADPFILPLIALLSGIGLMTIWRLFPNLGIRQSMWIALSSIVVLAGLQFPVYLHYLRRYKYIWLILGLVLTGLTIFLGTNPLGSGSTRWLQMFGIHFQPSEPLKLLLITYLAGFFTDRLSTYERGLERFLPTIILIGIALLLLIFQGDLGTASVFLLIYLAMLFTSQGNQGLLWFTPILFTAVGIAGYFFIDVVRLRVDTWINPFGDPIGASYQIIQSMVAIAEGNMIGTGPGLGSPGLIPVSVSDFIFSAVAEELGFLGVSIIILLFVILIHRGIQSAITTNNSFHRYLTLGLIFYFGIQSILIIGGNIGLLPLTGVTLPFLSYGGSSLLVSFIGLLILLTISHQTRSITETKRIYQPRFAMIGSLLILGLIIEIVATSLLSFWFNTALINRPENPRWIINDRFSARGDILDRNNQVLITNTGEIGSFQRTSSHIPLYPIIGYSHPVFGQTGIEASMFAYLRGERGYPYSTLFWHKLLYNQPPDGLNIRLTIDLDLQRSANELLGDQLGAIVLMNANSGEIITMASHPYFNAAELQTIWESLVTDENAPLINRATQGLYQPGAILFPYIIAAQPNLLQASPEPEILFSPLSGNLDCALPPEEPLNWQTVVANGCQNPQVALAEMIGADPLFDLYQELGFFSAPRLHLQVAEPITPDRSDLISFYRGDGQIKVSPLQMAMAASALTNYGVLPGPRIVNAFQDPGSSWNTLPKLQGNANVLAANSTNQITQLLRVTDLPYWQVISVVKADNGGTITWFMAGTSIEWQGQPIAAVVLLEDNAPELAESIGQSLIEEAIRFAGQIP
jgi:cell division protein FtsW (lipid II flippase)